MEQEIVKPIVPPILQALQNTPLTNKDFIEWFQQHESKLYTAIQFVKLPFIFQIGLWLEYLETKNLVVIGYPASYSIAYVDEENIPMFLIEKSDLDNDGVMYYQHERPTGYKSRTDSFRLGIIEGIKYVQAELESSANLKTT